MGEDGETLGGGRGRRKKGTASAREGSTSQRKGRGWTHGQTGSPSPLDGRNGGGGVVDGGKSTASAREGVEGGFGGSQGGEGTTSARQILAR